MTNQIQVSSKPPAGFVSDVDVAAVFVEVGEKILFLRRGPSNRIDPGRWGLPGGKLEPGESSGHAARRELSEETGIIVPASSSFVSVGALYMVKPWVQYTFNMYRLKLDDFPKVQLCTENDASAWLTVDEARQYPLMLGAEETLDYYLSI